MTPERWREVREAFDRIVDLGREEQARALADLATGDPELAREVGALVAAEARDATFLAAPATPLGGGDGAERKGERVGSWELLSPLGAGGMGRVFLARRADASFEKLVAVKFVHADLLSPWLRERFAAERQALAALEHPGIARLLDGGESPSGEPYLVLEYVEGRPLLAYALECGLDRRARVEVFLQVLEAVAYAHRHLVVHRDLKPGNILVTAEGEAKLLDFGVAKILEPSGRPNAVTRSVLRALTPEYASPEQVLGGATTTTTDVYSLGVVLFELLTGRRPYRVPTGAAEEWAEAALRQEVGRARELGADLEAILQRALRKNPAERYPGVDAFADDLRRFLSRQPVVARRGNALYRLSRFAVRHRTALAVSALALAVVVSILAISATRLKRERDRATAEAATARSVAGFLSTLFQKADPARTRGATLSAREVLEEGGRRIETELESQPVIQAELLTVLGAVHRDLGLLDEAAPLLEKALALRESQQPTDDLAIAETLYDLGLLDRSLGDLDRAEIRLERARAIRAARLSPDDPDLARSLSALGLVFRMKGDLQRARPLIEEAYAIALRSDIPGAETGRWLNHLGLVHQDGGAYEEARAAFEESLALLERSEGPESPLLAIPLDNLGQVLRTLGRPQEALPLHERALDLVERKWGVEHFQFGTALNSLGTTLTALGRREEAVEHYRRSAAVYEEALGSDHAMVAWPIRNQAEALVLLGRSTEALPLFERALAIRRAALGEAHPETAQSLSDLGWGHAEVGNLAEAERWLREGLARSRESLEPGNLGLAEAAIFLADLLVRTNRPQEARLLYAEALPIYRAAYSADDPQLVALEKHLAEREASSVVDREGVGDEPE